MQTMLGKPNGHVRILLFSANPLPYGLKYASLETDGSPYSPGYYIRNEGQLIDCVWFPGRQTQCTWQHRRWRELTQLQNQACLNFSPGSVSFWPWEQGTSFDIYPFFCEKTRSIISFICIIHTCIFLYMCVCMYIYIYIKQKIHNRKHAFLEFICEKSKQNRTFPKFLTHNIYSEGAPDTIWKKRG